MKPRSIPSFTSAELLPSRYRSWLVAAATLFTLSGCMVWPYVEVEKVALCKAEPGSAWKGDGTHVTFERDGVKYEAEVQERREFGDDAFWVQLAFDSVHGARIDGRYVPSTEKIPMIYDPKDAWIEVNGKRTAAVPTLWAPIDRAAVRSTPGPVLPVPANVNPQRTTLYGNVFIRFDIPPPQPGDKYRLGLGAIAIDGATTPLPVFDSCAKPARAGLDYVRC
jgi:hypothetical protein